MIGWTSGAAGRRVAIAVTAALGLAAGAGLVATIARDDPAAAPAADDRTAAAAVLWLAANLDSDATIYPATAPARHRLARAGLTALSGRQPAPGAFVIGTGAAAPATGGRAAVPVARFGSGSDALTVELVVAASPAGLARSQRIDAQLRRRAGAELMTNPSVTVASGPADLVRAGRVDLRLLGFLARAAGSARVVVAAIDTDAAERAVGVAARTVVLRRPSPAQLATLVAATPATYHPDIVGLRTEGDATTVTLRWPLVATDSVLGG